MTVLRVLVVIGACSLMFVWAMLAYDSLDTISTRTRRKCVLCIDSVLGCGPAVRVAICEVFSKKSSELFVVLFLVSCRLVQL